MAESDIKESDYYAPAEKESLSKILHSASKPDLVNISGKEINIYKNKSVEKQRSIEYRILEQFDSIVKKTDKKIEEVTGKSFGLYAAMNRPQKEEKDNSAIWLKLDSILNESSEKIIDKIKSVFSGINR